ncbi:hypothetical protein [Legionella tunisiensis]|uniref:hypothetical protein n=1 Tax=Legionella tunisiensis TaxID=1034944 RepID=UPI00037847EC|nr:hypothetical protein [Legionella tunisiensis]
MLNKDSLEDDAKNKHEEVKNTKRRTFFVEKSEGSPGKLNIFSLCIEINQLFSQFLVDENSDLFQEGVTKLDQLLQTLERALKDGGISIQYVLAGQCYYFKAACCLIAASKRSNQQIAHCYEGKKYLEKAIECGAAKNKEVAVFDDLAKTLETYNDELKKQSIVTIIKLNCKKQQTNLY